MIQQQIAQLTSTFKELASQYSNPAIILDHMPVLKDNPQAPLMVVGGLVAFIMLRRISKRKKTIDRPVSMIMPKPYLEEDSADHPLNKLADTPKLAAADMLQLSEESRIDPIALPAPAPAPAPRKEVRGPAQQLEDVTDVAFRTKPAFSADEARMRAMLQAALVDLGAPYLIMARTSLSAILEPETDGSKSKRDNVLAAINNKHLDFALFDRAGRLALAIKVATKIPLAGMQAIERQVVWQAVAQAGIPAVELPVSTNLDWIKDQIAPHLKIPQRAAAPARKPAETVSLRKTPRAMPEAVQDTAQSEANDNVDTAPQIDNALSQSLRAAIRQNAQAVAAE